MGPLTSATVKVLSSTGLVLVKNCIIERELETQLIMHGAAKTYNKLIPFLNKRYHYSSHFCDICIHKVNI